MAAFLRRRTLDVGSPSGVVSSFLGRLLTTRGDILRRGASAPERLAIGSSGTILRSDGTDAAWATVATALGAILTARGQIIRQGSSAPEALAASTANTFLGGDGTDVTTRTAAQVRSSLSIVTGTWTPTLTNVTNMAASTAYLSNYIRINDMVVCFGRFDADVTAVAPTSTELGISLPIASALTSTNQLGGTAATTQDGGLIIADTTNDRASVQWSAAINSANTGWGFIFGYIIV